MKNNNTDTLLFSILVPAYNVSAYISKCIESVLMQSFKQWEVVIVDDGSTDGTGILCDQYAMKDQRIRVLHQYNRGVAETRNILLKEAKGKYYIFLDPDDFWTSDEMLSNVANSIFKYHADMVVWWLQEYNMETGEVKKKKNCIREKPYLQTGEEFLYSMVSEGVPCWWSWLYAFRSDLWKESCIVFSSGRRVCEDVEVLFRVILQAKNVWVIGKYFYSYRKFRKESITNENTTEKIADMLDVADRNINYIFNDNKMKMELKKRLIASFSSTFIVCGEGLYTLQKQEKEVCYSQLRERQWMLGYVYECKSLKFQTKAFIVRCFGIRVGFKLLRCIAVMRIKTGLC